MRNGDKLAMIVFGSFALLSAAALTIPYFRESTMSRRLFAGTPVWIFLVASAIGGAVIVALILVNGRRIKRGKKPL